MRKWFACILFLTVLLCGMRIYPVENFAPEERAYLLNLARAALDWSVRDGNAPSVDSAELPETLREKAGCFVTLTHRTAGLRGCMGSLAASEPLYKQVIDKTITAAHRDPRFEPVLPDELGDIKISVSILTVPKRLFFESPSGLLRSLTPGRDGVVIETRFGSSTFLPQVWDGLPDKSMFLSQLCAKHGAPQTIWLTDPTVRVYTYRAIVFEEDEFGRIAVGSGGAVAGPNGARIVGNAVWGTPLPSDTAPEPGTRLEPFLILSPDSDISHQ